MSSSSSQHIEVHVAARENPLRIAQRIKKCIHDAPTAEVVAVGLGQAINALARTMNLLTEQAEPLLQVVQIRTSSMKDGTAMLSLSFARADDNNAPLRRPAFHRAVSNPCSSSLRSRPTDVWATPQLRRLASAPIETSTASASLRDAPFQVDLYKQLSAGVVPMTGKALQRLREYQGLSPTASAAKSSSPDFGRHVVYFGENLPDFGTRGASCGICFEEKSPLIRLCEADDMGAKCDGFCTDCVKTYAEQLVQNALHFCPWLRCPTCRRRVPTGLWSELVEPSIWERYLQNARSLLTIRCRECETAHTMLVEPIGWEDEKKVFASLDAEQLETLRAAWEKYCRAEEPADVLIGVLQQLLGEDTKKMMSRAVLALVRDLERRLTLQLAWLSKVPQTRTLCCHAKVCFKCKVMGWHPGISCEQKQQKLYMGSSTAVQACPGCGILTQKLDGCDEIACVCGRTWHWVSKERENEEDLRPLVCLASRCPGASACVRLLVEHTASVNEPGEHGSVPLLYAARSLDVGNLRELLSRGADPNCSPRPHDEEANEVLAHRPTDVTPLSAVLGLLRYLPTRDEDKWSQAAPALRELVKAGGKLTHAAFAKLEVLSSSGQWSAVREALQDAWLVVAAEKPKAVVYEFEFTDADGDVVKMKRSGSLIQQYFNGKLEVELVQVGLRIDKEARTYNRDDERHGKFKPEEDIDKIIALRDALFRPEVPLWVRAQWDTPDAVKQAIAGAHSHAVDAVVLAAVARRFVFSNGSEWAECQEIANVLKDHASDSDDFSEEKWEKLKSQAATYILHAELRSAYHQDREPELPIVRAALERGADPNGLFEYDEWRSEFPVNMLVDNMWAVGATTLEALQLLLDARADVNAKTSFGQLKRTAFDMAVEHNHYPIAEALIKHGAGSGKGEDSLLKHSILEQTTTQEWSDIVSRIVSNWSDKEGKPPLWALVRSGDVEAVKVHLAEQKLLDEQKANTTADAGDANLTADAAALEADSAPRTPPGTPPSTTAAAPAQIEDGLLRCRRDHPLRPSRRPRNICNLCDKTGTAYRCSNGCNWDACQECWDLCSGQLEKQDDPGATEAAVEELEAAVSSEDAGAENANVSATGPHAGEAENKNDDDEPLLTGGSRLRRVRAESGEEEAAEGTEEGSDADRTEENKSWRWLEAVLGLFCMSQPEMRPEMESCLSAHMGQEKFVALLQVAKMLLVRIELQQAFEEQRPINEKVVLDLLEQGAFLGAPDDFPAFQEHCSMTHLHVLDRRLDSTDLNALSLLIEEADEHQPVDVLERVFAKLAEKITLGESGNTLRPVGLFNPVPDMLANWLESKCYVFLPGCLAVLPKMQPELTRQSCETYLKKLSVSPASLGIEVELEKLINAWQESIDKRQDPDNIDDWNAPPLWLLVRFGLWPTLLQRLRAEGPDPTEAEFAEMAVALLQNALRRDTGAFQGKQVSVQELEKALSEKAGEEMWQQCQQVAYTTALVYEVQEALVQDRAPDETIVKYFLANSADANALGRPSTLDEELSDFITDDDEEDDEEEGGESEGSISGDIDDNEEDGEDREEGEEGEEGEEEKEEDTERSSE